MFIPGIKLGPQGWLNKLDQSRAVFAEIWYRVDKPEWYLDMFQTLRARGVGFGLHFWGITTPGHEANLAYPGSDRLESIDLVRRCLETAASQGAVYVNLHTGNTRLLHLNLDTSEFFVDESCPAISDTESVRLRNQAIIELSQSARKLNIQLLLELVPQASYNHDDRAHPIPQYPTSPQGLLDPCRQGDISFTNDFCHTYAYDMVNFDSITKKFAPYTRLCHINTLYYPYNGTDAHGGILPADFTKPGVFPTKSKLIDLLNLISCQTQHPIWLVGEPKSHHLENYQELVSLLARLPDTDRVECPKSGF